MLGNFVIQEVPGSQEDAFWRSVLYGCYISWGKLTDSADGVWRHTDGEGGRVAWLDGLLVPADLDLRPPKHRPLSVAQRPEA